MTITDQQALRDRRVTGCHYDTGLCACPDAPHTYEHCRAPRQLLGRRNPAVAAETVTRVVGDQATPYDVAAFQSFAE